MYFTIIDMIVMIQELLSSYDTLVSPRAGSFSRVLGLGTEAARYLTRDTSCRLLRHLAAAYILFDWLKPLYL